MTGSTIDRHRTAMRRAEVSRPVRLAIEDGLLGEDITFFDYGCGHGDDVKILNKIGVSANGWDPVHSPQAAVAPARIVNLGYVVNVIEDPTERVTVVRRAWDLAQDVLVVAARLTAEARDTDFEAYGDGFVTGRNTFQKFYEQQELRDWVDDVLDASSIAVAPGVFYVFRSEEKRTAFLANRQRRRVELPRLRRSEALFDDHQELLRPLMEFVADRGRLPADFEISISTELREVFGSVRKAFRVVSHVTGDEQWEQIKEARSRDFLVYLALSKFDKRPKFAHLPPEIQLDVKAFFGKYRQACNIADILLYSAGDGEMLGDAFEGAAVGRVTPLALYVHISALPVLAPLLRVYEGCARSYIGEVDGANVIKLHRTKPAITYMTYPEFESDPHPALTASTRIELKTFDLKMRDFRDWDDPPVLYRKDELVGDDFPHKKKFAALTRQEEKQGLLDVLELVRTKRSWERLLESRQLKIGGHRLTRA